MSQHKIFTFTLLATTLLSASLFSYPQSKMIAPSEDVGEIQTLIAYCNLDLPPKWKLANLSFSSLYLFSVNEHGDVVTLKKFRDEYVGENKVRACVSRWKIKGFANGTQFAVYFVWKHGKGWIRQEISGNDFTHVMTMRDVGVDKLVKNLPNRSGKIK